MTKEIDILNFEGGILSDFKFGLYLSWPYPIVLNFIKATIVDPMILNYFKPISI